MKPESQVQVGKCRMVVVVVVWHSSRTGRTCPSSQPVGDRDRMVEQEELCGGRQQVVAVWQAGKRAGGGENAERKEDRYVANGNAEREVGGSGSSVAGNGENAVAGR